MIPFLLESRRSFAFGSEFFDRVVKCSEWRVPAWRRVWTRWDLDLDPAPSSNCVSCGILTYTMEYTVQAMVTEFERRKFRYFCNLTRCTRRK